MERRVPKLSWECEEQICHKRGGERVWQFVCELGFRSKISYKGREKERVAKFELGVRPKFLAREGRESDNIGLTARKDFITREGRGSGKIWVEREGFARERENGRSYD